VPLGSKLPPSLRNIFRELQEDLGLDQCPPSDLEAWARQGVLLLNSSLTVEEGKPGSHSRWGWGVLTTAVIQLLAERDAPLVSILWGKQAQNYRDLLEGPSRRILSAPHPSPLSAHRGFFGSQPFSQTNQFLKAQGQSPINWMV
jgi:uracil-DNA glycosylase